MWSLECRLSGSAKVNVRPCLHGRRFVPVRWAGRLHDLATLGGRDCGASSARSNLTASSTGL